MKQSTSFIEGPREQQGSSVESDPRSELELPQLIGSEPDAAVDQLRALALVPAVRSAEVADEDFVGVICAQEPAAGSVLEPGATVVVFVGQLPPTAQPIGPPSGEEAPLDEDDWFDIELPGVDSAERAEATAFTATGSPAESIEPALAGRGSHARRSRGLRPLRVAALLTACVVVLVTVLGLRSCSDPHPSQRTPHARPRELRAPTSDLHRSSARPVRRTTAGPSAARRAQPRRSPVHVPAVPAPVVPPSTSTAVPPVPDACEFCLERPTP